MDANIFREYDIRGIVGTQLTDETVAVLARAIAMFYQQHGAKRIAIGYDARESSPRFCKILVDALVASGCDVVEIGRVPTPVLYHTVFTRDVDGGVMITGSHNPPDHNGFKICLGKDALFGSQIQDIRALAVTAAASALRTALPGDKTRAVASEPDVRLAKIENLDVVDAYVADLTTRTDIGPRKLKAVIDAGNGMGGVTAAPVYRKLGVELIEMFTEPDSTFPNHHPDPTVEANLTDLISKVRETGADIGIAFDGDGDRIGVVDETGRIIWGDELMVLFSRALLAEYPGATIIGEVKCSQTLFDDITAHGGNAVMWKAGHSLIKAKMKETNAALAGEMSGHIFFADRFYGFDDATYAGARVLETLSKTDKPLSALLADLPRTFSTPEIRVPCPDDKKFEVVKKVARDFARDHEVITIDGARIVFEQGWGLVRASNTQAILVLRSEANSQAALDEIRAALEAKLKELLA